MTFEIAGVRSSSQTTGSNGEDTRWVGPPICCWGFESPICLQCHFSGYYEYSKKVCELKQMASDCSKLTKRANISALDFRIRALFSLGIQSPPQTSAFTLRPCCFQPLRTENCLCCSSSPGLWVDIFNCRVVLHDVNVIILSPWLPVKLRTFNSTLTEF